MPMCHQEVGHTCVSKMRGSRRKFRRCEQAWWWNIVRRGWGEWMRMKQMEMRHAHTQKKETAAEQQCVSSFIFYFWHTPAFHQNPSEVILFLDTQVMHMSCVLPPISTHSLFPPLSGFTVSARRIWGVNNGRCECSYLLSDRRSIVWYLHSTAAFNISLQKVKQVQTMSHIFMHNEQKPAHLFEYLKDKEGRKVQDEFLMDFRRSLSWMWCSYSEQQRTSTNLKGNFLRGGIRV